MPNWCSNHLYVRGDKTKIQEIVDAVAKYEGKDSCKLFETIVPMPKELEDTTAGKGDNWYDWRLSNWGTKWEACYADVTETEEYDDGQLYANIAFDTAWSPPIPVYDALEKKGITVVAEYEEPGMGFAGRYEGGKDETWEYRELGCQEDQECLAN